MSPKPTSKISKLLKDHETALLNEWVGDQSQVLATQQGRISEAELREQSRDFLSLLRRATEEGDLSDLRTPAWREVLEMLAGVSRSRARQGFTPAQTASFVFSLKRPLFSRLRQELAGDGAAVAEETWTANQLLDRLGLHTAEIFIKSREETIGRLERVQRMESVGRLAGGIAHETNNQIAVVLGFAEYVLQGANLTPDQRQDLEQIKAGAERVAQLTRQLLALSRRQTLHPQALDLDVLVRESQPVVGRLLGPENPIVLDLEPGAKWVRADHTQVVQVLLNLTINAREAMPDGGRVIISTRRAAEVPPDGRLGRHWPDSESAVLLSVADEGTGIDPSVSGRIFEPFFTTKPVGGGTGLGLSVVEGIIEQSNGEIWVSSRPGRGTTFTFALPLVEPTEAIEEAGVVAAW